MNGESDALWGLMNRDYVLVYAYILWLLNLFSLLVDLLGSGQLNICENWINQEEGRIADGETVREF